MLKRFRSGVRGAATVEFYVVALLALLPLCLGMLQTALLLIANHQVDLAAFTAARTGAVTGGDETRMRMSFAKALSPLLVSTDGGVDAGNITEKVLQAQARSVAAMTVFLRMEVLSPTAAAREDFAVERNGQRVMPNDALEFRSTRPGARSGISLQEASLLEVEAVWCHPLLVPFATELLIALLRELDSDPWNQVCYLDRRVPIRSVGVAPMQSDFRLR
jgi:hypothetical protein